MEQSSKQFKTECLALSDKASIHEEYIQRNEIVVGETSNTNITYSFEDLEAKHKVFLSHSGVQKDFVEQLCIDLETWDRYPFFDKRRSSIPIGVKFPELIFDAIKQCQVGVLVLSKDFFMATKWPMLELVAMVRELKRKKPGSSIKIIPVFYKLSQEEWLDKENRSEWISQWEKWAYDDQSIDIEEWKAALGALKSVNSLMMKHGEVHLRKEIVKAVCDLVLPEIRLDDSHVQGRSRLCKILIEKINETKQQDGIQVMGLYGVGGIGKTTICKAMCNELFQKFHGRVCHIELNSASEVELLRKLLKRFTNIQHKLLKELDIDECRDKLKRCIVKDPIFLAIDNLSDSDAARDQAKALLGSKWGRGSIVMVVARGLGELTCFVDEKDCLEMPKLKEHEARSLFLDHVELGPHSTTKIDEGLVSHCLERCHFSKGEGLGYHYIPLALEVLGKLLGSLGYVPERWEQQLKKVDAFRQVVSREEHPIFSVLRTSYSNLSKEAQMVFMDAALFLPSHPFFLRLKYKWNLFDWLRMVHPSGAGETVSQIFEGLKKRSLLADLGDGRTKVVMHDLWREFCVAEAAVANFEEGRWLFVEEESSKLAECSPGPGRCWGHMRRMCFLNEGWRSLNGVQLDAFVNLSVLKVETGSFILHGSSLELDLKGLKHLKSLELNTSRVFNMKCLGLGSLLNLAYLRWINHTTPSPDVEDIGRLTKLQVLELGGFGGEKLPDMSMLTSLRLVRFGNCHGVITITGLSARMTNIEVIEIPNCTKLRECPGLGALHALEVLFLDQCDGLEELPCLQLLTSLRTLSMGNCQLLRAVPGLGDLVALEELRATGCVNLEVLPDLRNLSKLRVLKCGSCMALKSFTCTGPLLALESMDLTLCGSLEEMPDLSNFPQLKVLELGGCTGLTRLTSSAPLYALLLLDLEGCSKVSALPDHLSRSLDLSELRLQRSGILLRESEIRELQASCTELVVFRSSDPSNKYGIVESGSSTATGVADGESELQINVRNGFRWRRLPDSLPRDKVMKLTYTYSGGSLLALMSNGMHKLWKWECKLNDPEYKDTISSIPELWLPATGIRMINDINEAIREEVVPSLVLFPGDIALLSTSGGSVSLYDIRTFKCVISTMHPPPIPTSLAVYPYDPTILLIGTEDSTIQIRGIDHNSEVCKLEGHQKRVTSLAFSCTSANSTCVLASLGADDQWCVWNTEAWGKRQSQSKALQPDRRVECIGDIRVQFYNDQRHVLVVGKLQLAVYDTLTLDYPIFQWIPESPFATPISDATFSCNGRSVFVGFADGSIAVLRVDLRPLSRFHTPGGLSGSTAYPLSIAAHPHNPIQFALGMSDGSVIVVEPVASGSGEATGSAAVLQEDPRVHDAALARYGCFDYICSCLFSTSSLEGDSPNGTDICGAESDGVEFNEQSRCQSRRLPDTTGPRKQIARLLYSNAGDAILALTSDGVHKRWNWDNEATVSVPPHLWKPTDGNMQMVNSSAVTYAADLQISSDDHRVIFAFGGEVYELEMLGTQVIKTISIQTPATVTSLAYLGHEENIIVLGTEHSTIQIYDNHLKEVVCTLKGHEKRITGLAVCNRFNVLVSLGEDLQLCLWRIEDWRKKQLHYGPLQPDKTISCCGDIRIQYCDNALGILVVGKSHLAIYDVVNLKMRVAAQMNATRITDATYSNDGMSVFVTHSDCSVMVLSAHDLCSVGRIAVPIHTSRGESGSTSNYPVAIAAHPKKEGQLALGMSDGSVIVWEPFSPESGEASSSSATASLRVEEREHPVG